VIVCLLPQVTCVAMERSLEKRVEYIARIGQYDPKQLVFVDESSVDRRCQDRFSSTILLGGPGMQGTNEEVSPDTSRCWLVRTIKFGSYGRSPGTREALGVSPGFCGVSPDRGKVVRS